MEVIVGTYEELILGYKLNSADDGYNFETSFTDHSHTGCVRTVALSERDILATGSSDESIKLFNLKTRKEIGALLHHDGFISHLSFFGKSHMFSCSSDGTIGVWKTGSWECQKTLRGHKEPVNSISIHPSGKMAVSVSRNKMRTWNLITGKCAYITNLKNGADIVKWTADGTHYVIAVNNVAEIYSVETASVVQIVRVDYRINCMDFLKDDNILVLCGEGGKVEFYNMKTESPVYSFSTETNRVKGIGICTCDRAQDSTWLTTGSSDGWIKVWKITQTKDKWTSSLEASVDTKFRIVSLAIKPVRQINEQKKTSVVKKAKDKFVQMEADSDSVDDSDDEDDNSSDSEELSVQDSATDSNEEEFLAENNEAKKHASDSNSDKSSEESEEETTFVSKVLVKNVKHKIDKKYADNFEMEKKRKLAVDESSNKAKGKKKKEKLDAPKKKTKKRPSKSKQRKLKSKRWN